jgi:hypothetical protein
VSTPENSDFDLNYGQSSCTDGEDNDGDDYTDGTDSGCGGWGPTPTPSPRCPGDNDCDGWSDDIELQYGSNAYDGGNNITPEDSDFDEAYAQNSCADGSDNDRDNAWDANDPGCGGHGPTPPPLFTPTPIETSLPGPT